MESLESMMQAMQEAESRWQAEERPLTYEHLIALKRGVQVTVVKHYASGVSDVYRATVTTNRQRGWTDGRGLWCAEQEMPAWARIALREAQEILMGHVRHTTDRLFPSYTICFKERDNDYRIRYVVGQDATQVYYGWDVNPPPRQ